jgi:2,4-dienoyl-CoA reductase-like NADH-dependent reductase (Old Yellow Enzyme family)
MYEKPFEPGRIGKLHLKNRIAMAAMLFWLKNQKKQERLRMTI